MAGEGRSLRLRQIAFVAVRLLSVYVLAQAIFYFPQAAQLAFSGGNFDANNWAFIAGFILFLAIAFLLWNQAERLARAATRGADGEVIHTPITMDAIELVAFSILGVFLLMNSIPRLASEIAQLLAPSTFDQFLPPQGPSDNYRVAKLLEAAGTLGRVLIGLWLLLGTHSFVAWIRRLRERARTGPPLESVDADSEE